MPKLTLDAETIRVLKSENLDVPLKTAPKDTVCDDGGAVTCNGTIKKATGQTYDELGGQAGCSPATK